MPARRLLGSSLTLALMAGMLVVSATRAGAANITVNSLADDGSGGCTLREAITNANADDQSGSTDCTAGSGADNITFSVTGAIYLGSELPSVTGTLSVTGPGAASLTISGDTNNDDNVTANVRVISVDSGASLDLSGVTISEGRTASFGAGIRNNGGTLTVTSSTFSGNTADVDGGGIFNNQGTLTVTSSLFTGNGAGQLGGGIWNVGTAGVTSSTFSGNTADVDGGGIFSGAGALTVTSSTLTGNSAGFFGGGISAQAGTLTVTDCTFSANSASSGGAIHTFDSTTGTIADTTISGNIATFNGNTTVNNGAGIYTSGTLTVSNSIVSANKADDHGGGIHSEGGTVTVSNSTLTGNEADDDDGGGIFSSGTLTVSNSTFSVNIGDEAGGGIYNDGGIVDVTSSAFSGNTAGTDGGGITNSGGTLDVTRSTFIGNVSADRGGGIFTSGFSSIRYSTFSGNGADLGGGIYGGSSALTVTDSTFSGNGATSIGGGIYWVSGSLNVTNSTFSGNGAGVRGGGIFTSGFSSIRYSTFSGNSAGFGGGISSTGSTLLRATIVANSPGGDCSGSLGGAYNLSSDLSCLFSGTSVGGTDPMLGPLANNGGPTQTHALPESSPAVDVIPEGQPASAECGTTIDTDQRGEPRPEDDRCDIGAYEEQDPAVQPNPGPPGLTVPNVLSMHPTSGPVGTQVAIGGNNLQNATVRFNGIVAPVQSNSATQILITVPEGATTGPVVVATSQGADTAGTFTVTTGPGISGFAPAAGKVGTQVVISGVNFTGTTVAFGGVQAAFVVDSPTQITSVVPPHAGTGPIEITTDGGTATSAQAFVVRHPRSASLHLPELRGSISATDGWADCASQVPVTLQRFSNGRFRAVDSTTTKLAGNYRFGLPEEPGRYRVAAQHVTLSSGDICLRARSPVVTL